MRNPEKHMMLIKGLLVLNDEIYKASDKIGNIRNNKLIQSNTKNSLRMTVQEFVIIKVIWEC